MAKCIDCGADIAPLDVFPGSRCLPCWRPIGEARAAILTAADLVKMWGGK